MCATSSTHLIHLGIYFEEDEFWLATANQILNWMLRVAKYLWRQKTSSYTVYNDGTTVIVQKQCTLKLILHTHTFYSFFFAFPPLVWLVSDNNRFYSA